MDGLLNVDKPRGLSSFRVVQHVRRILQVKKAGHCGTLDPHATGVLLIVFGRATKAAARFTSEEKVYRARIRLGVRTDSGDITGKILEESAVPDLSADRIEEALKGFLGVRTQITPMISAVKVRGKRLYRWAREGVSVQPPPRLVEIFSAHLLESSPQSLSVRVRCSKGTYIRTLAEDLGKALGVPATLEDLTRESSGPFKVSEAVSWEEVLSGTRESLLSKAIGVRPDKLTNYGTGVCQFVRPDPMPS